MLNGMGKMAQRGLNTITRGAEQAEIEIQGRMIETCFKSVFEFFSGWYIPAFAL
jgi:hypothetical protein